MRLGVGVGLGLTQVTGSGGGGAFAPSLDFSDARNSQYYLLFTLLW